MCPTIANKGAIQQESELSEATNPKNKENSTSKENGLVPSDSELPFHFRRLQFPVKPCFAMTVNKSQGQTFKAIGVDLSTACFSHGMFYVAASRVGSSNELYLLAPKKKTRNVVYLLLLYYILYYIIPRETSHYFNAAGSASTTRRPTITTR